MNHTNSMKYATTKRLAGPVLCLLAFIVTSLVIQACAPTRAGKIVQAREAYTSTLTVLTDARKAGLIDDQAARDIEQARRIAAEAIDSMEATADVDPDAFRQALRTFRTALDRMAEWQTRVESRVESRK